MIHHWKLKSVQNLKVRRSNINRVIGKQMIKVSGLELDFGKQIVEDSGLGRQMIKVSGLGWETNS